MSLATELVDEGFDVTVLEKNPYLGGRASNTKDWKMHDTIPVGPHVFVTLYNNLLNFFEKIGVKDTISWEKKLFIEIISNGQHEEFHKSILPSPFSRMPWLMHYKFLSWYDKFSNLRFVNRLFFLTLDDVEKLDHENAYNYLSRYGITKNSIDKFWRFLAFSLLNVPLEICSAGEFSLLMKHFTFAKNGMFGFAKVGLGDEYITKAEDYISKRKGKIVKDTHIEKIVFKNGKIDHLQIKVDGKRKKVKADIYVSTLTPTDLRSILPEEVLFDDYFRHLNAFEGVPYISVNLWFDKKITRKKFWALLNDSGTSRNMNTDFYDQSNIYKSRKKRSFITSNIIYSKPYDHMTDGEIVEKTLEELHETFPDMNAKLIHQEVHRTPYVIYAPYPGMREHKLSHKTSVNNFFIAGDWTINELTQCMESAVRSGYKCAEEILKQYSIEKSICNNQVI